MQRWPHNYKFQKIFHIEAFDLRTKCLLQLVVFDIFLFSLTNIIKEIPIFIMYDGYTRMRFHSQADRCHIPHARNCAALSLNGRLVQSLNDARFEELGSDVHSAVRLKKIMFQIPY